MKDGGLNLLSTNDQPNQEIEDKAKDSENIINILSKKRNDSKVDEKFEEYNPFDPFEIFLSPYENMNNRNNSVFYKELNEYNDILTIKLLFVSKFEKKYQYIYQLNNGYFLCHNEKLLSIFDRDKKLLFENDNYFISFIRQLKKDSILIIAFDSYSNYFLYKINLYENTFKKEEEKAISIKIYNICISEKNYIISCPEGTFNYQRDIMNITNNDLSEENRISEDCYKNGTIIDDNILILINNKDNKGYLLIYNLDKSEKIKLYDYLHKLFINNLHVIKLNYRTFILLSCEKTNEKGVFLLKLKDNNEINLDLNYFNIPDLIPKCVCPIKNFTNMKILTNNDLPDTEFFLVGGDNNIKIYYINEEVLDKFSIELIANVCFGDDKKNQNITRINAIKQLSNNGNIIICFNSKEIKEFYLKGNLVE